MTDSVTVVMTCLDSERFVEEAIESVLAQIYVDWQLVVVDDGSEDRTPRILARYAEQHPDRILVVAHPGKATRGMSASRNLAVRHAAGKYVAFLDADDVWLPSKLEEQVATLSAFPQAAMVFGAAESWHSWEGNSRNDDGVPEFLFEVDRLWAPPHLVPQILRGERPTTTVGLVRRWVVSHVGGFEERFRGMYEDQVFFAKVALEFPIYVSGTCTYRWRQHAGSSCAAEVRAGTYDESRAVFLAWIRRHLVENSIDHDEIWSELRRQEARLAPRSGGPSRPRRAAAVERARREAIRLLPPRALETGRRVEERLRAGARSRPRRRVQLGDLARTVPVSRSYGSDRGTPVDRYYIEQYLAEHAQDVRGRVLEVKDDRYTSTIGGDRVDRADILDILPSNPKATIVADLEDGDGIPDGAFDCIVLTQTLQMVYDLGAAATTLGRILAPEGVLLVTVPGITSLADREWRASWYWNFTTHSLRRILEESFPSHAVEVRAYGNVMAATAFLQGLAVEELPRGSLEIRDSDYELLIAGRAIKHAPASA